VAMPMCGRCNRDAKLRSRLIGSYIHPQVANQAIRGHVGNCGLGPLARHEATCPGAFSKKFRGLLPGDRTPTLKPCNIRVASIHEECREIGFTQGAEPDALQCCTDCPGHRKALLGIITGFATQRMRAPESEPAHGTVAPAQ